jgi:hypothetical protein
MLLCGMPTLSPLLDRVSGTSVVETQAIGFFRRWQHADRTKQWRRYQSGRSSETAQGREEELAAHGIRGARPKTRPGLRRPPFEVAVGIK